MQLVNAMFDNIISQLLLAKGTKGMELSNREGNICQLQNEYRNIIKNKR